MPNSQFPTSAIDVKALQAIDDMAGKEILVEVIHTYLEDVPQLWQSIQTAVTQGDAITLRRVAHTFKSTSATLGATRLAQLCKQLEALGRDRNLTEAPKLLTQLGAELEAVKVALQVECQKYQP